MNAEKYWSQRTVYFFATCALFPEKLTGEVLTDIQMNDYIIGFEDTQMEMLAKYQSEGMLRVQAFDKSEGGRQFMISDINQASFRNRLIEYLEMYREGELLLGFSSYGDSYEDTKELLYAYLRKSGRELPVVNPRNIWEVWMDDRPFWEAVLTAALLDGAVIVTNIELVHGTAEYGGTVPRAEVKLVRSLDLLPVDMVTRQNNRRLARIVIARNSSVTHSVFIEVEGGYRHLVSESLRTDMGPYSLLRYLINNPGEVVTRDFAARRIQNCSVQNLSDVVRQAGFDRNLKNLFFEVSAKDKVQLKKEVYLTDEEIQSIPN